MIKNYVKWRLSSRAYLQEGDCFGGGGGGASLTLTLYTYMFLPFGVLVPDIWYSDRWVLIRDEGAQIT